MDSKKFFQELRKVIREEVNKAIDEKMNVKTELKVNDFKKDIQHSIRLQEQIKRAENKENPTLSDILNETRDAMVNESRTIKFDAADAPGFNRSMMAEMMGYGDMPKRGSSPIPTTDIDGRPVQNIDNNVKDALTRDYSTLMKAIKDKKK